jgi:hypothetical protein
MGKYEYKPPQLLGHLMPLTETMYLRYNTKQEAKQATMDFWLRLLGRPVNPDDITNAIFESLDCQNGQHAYLVLVEPLYSQLFPKLTLQEQNFVTANMVPVSNTQVQSCLASIPRPGR